MNLNLKQNWKKCLEIGCTPDLHYLEKKRIYLLNAIAVLSVFLSIFVTLIYIIFDFSIKYIPMISVPVSLAILWFNHKKKYVLAKNIGYYGMLMSIIFWSLFFRKIGIHYIFIALATSSILIFEERKMMFFSIFLSSFFYLFYTIYDYNTPFVRDLHVNYLAMNTFFIFITAGIETFLAMLYVDITTTMSRYVDENYESLKIAEKNLQKSNRELVKFNYKLDELVKKSNEELYSYQEAINDNLYSIVTDYNGLILKINDVYREKLGYTKKEISGMNIAALKSNFHSDAFYEEINKTIYSGNVWRGESKIKAKNNSTFWLVSSILPVKNSDGTIKRFLTVSANITEEKLQKAKRKKAKEQLIQSGIRLNLVLENQSDLIQITDKYGVCKYVNKTYSDFFGKPKEFFIGSNNKTIEPEQPSDNYLKLFEILSFENPKFSFLEVLKDLNGHTKWILWNELALFDDNKEITEIFSFGHDITNLKKIEFQNANYIAQFEEMAFKTSHNFRGPLSSIMGLMNLLEVNDLKEEEVHQVASFLKTAVLELENSSRELTLFINKYQIEKQTNQESNKTFDFSEAKSKHLNWKFKIRNFLDGTSSLTYNHAVSKYDSELGKWYYSEGKEKYGHIPSMQKFEKEHEKLHTTVKEILALKSDKKIENSELKYNELLIISDKIIILLDESEMIVNG